MKTLDNISELKNTLIGVQWGKLINATRKMPCMATFERGRLTRIKFHGERDGKYIPFVDAEDGQVKIVYHGSEWRGEWTVGEFIEKYGSFKKRR